jgi:hypothetical protein
VGEQIVDAPATNVVLQLRATRRITGRVIGEGRAPVSAFVVTISRLHGEPEMMAVFTPANGEFELADAPAGPIEIRITANGYVDAVKELTDHEAAKPIAITLVPNRQP